MISNSTSDHNAIHSSGMPSNDVWRVNVHLNSWGYSGTYRRRNDSNQHTTGCANEPISILDVKVNQWQKNPSQRNYCILLRAGVSVLWGQKVIYKKPCSNVMPKYGKNLVSILTVIRNRSMSSRGDIIFCTFLTGVRFSSVHHFPTHITIGALLGALNWGIKQHMNVHSHEFRS